MRALLVGLLMPTLALAEGGDDDERYLLGDPGVRIDLPVDWNAIDWTDASFEAEKGDKSVKLWVWNRPGQVPVVADDLDAWAKVFLAKVEQIEGKDPEVTAKSVETRAGRPTARFTVAFDFGKDLRGVLHGATFTVEGRVTHLATLAAAARADVGLAALDGVLDRLEARKPPAAVAEGAQVSASGVTATLPAGWRAPLPAELPGVAQLATKLGVEDLTPCWTAIRPLANAEPELLLTCPAGAQLGVVDSYSFAGVDAALRPMLFGKAEVPAAKAVTAASGQTGFLYVLPTEGRALAMAVVPYGQGVARTWALGPGGEAFEPLLTGLVGGASYEGAHPAGFGDQVSYWVSYRPTSPVTLGAGAGVLAVLGGAAFALRRGLGGRRSYEDVA